eukprot:CAMPEP_0115309598 /NCGR_PEP_ID=MMETSP0270-20121206/74340_1 /TAXON_ID=71861 /ORGANISM="Scrippsiella trochoidea, Strain CCMP3099" /LENGTH=195 /DNA_ID=CAMNT_0002728279 /DNA_START=19 /DNA_END=604 /DNA_ORIENTATION=+
MDIIACTSLVACIGELVSTRYVCLGPGLLVFQLRPRALQHIILNPGAPKDPAQRLHRLIGRYLNKIDSDIDDMEEVASKAFDLLDRLDGHPAARCMAALEVAIDLLIAHDAAVISWEPDGNTHRLALQILDPPELLNDESARVGLGVPSGNGGASTIVVANSGSRSDHPEIRWSVRAEKRSSVPLLHALPGTAFS